MPNDPHIRPTCSLSVDILAFPDVQLLDVAGPLQVFASVNELCASRGDPSPYRPRVVARDREIMTSSGLGLTAFPLPDPDDPVDTVVVAGGYGVRAAILVPATVEWVRKRARRARRTASVCTGAFLLGEAGLLDGRRAVTHWTRCAELSQRYPTTRVETDAIFIADGPVWTSAGITAGIDLCLALVEQDLGSEVALAVARHLVMFLKRPGGQAQFSTTLALQTADAQFATLHTWMRDNLERNLTVGILAAQAGMSERNFSRRYLDATGTTPSRAVEHLRVEAARDLLLRTQWPAKRIAMRCGFGSDETLRRSFAKLLATTPQEYRSRFRSDFAAAGQEP